MIDLFLVFPKMGSLRDQQHWHYNIQRHKPLRCWCATNWQHVWKNTTDFNTFNWHLFKNITKTGYLFRILSHNYVSIASCSGHLSVWRCHNIWRHVPRQCQCSAIMSVAHTTIHWHVTSFKWHATIHGHILMKTRCANKHRDMRAIGFCASDATSLNIKTVSLSFSLYTYVYNWSKILS